MHICVYAYMCWCASMHMKKSFTRLMYTVTHNHTVCRGNVSDVHTLMYTVTHTHVHSDTHSCTQ